MRTWAGRSIEAGEVLDDEPVGTEHDAVHGEVARARGVGRVGTQRVDAEHPHAPFDEDARRLGIDRRMPQRPRRAEVLRPPGVDHDDRGHPLGQLAEPLDA